METLFTDQCEGNVPINLYVEPPEPNILTDEESGNEEDEAQDILHLPGRQLLAPAEIIVGDIRVGGANEDEPQPSTSGQTCHLDSAVNTLWLQKRIKKKQTGLTSFWIEGDFENQITEFPSPDYSQSKDKTPVELFEDFFDDDFWELLRSETEMYMRQKNASDAPPVIEELKCFVGILILSGYNVLPSCRNYWDQKSDMHNEMVSNAMRRNRFLTILKYIHCADNLTDFDGNDKVWKLRKLISMLKDKCMQHFVPTPDMDYDESMIKYFGRHPMKQFIRGKPIRFGFKVWCLNTPDGYLVNFDVYQGKHQNLDSDHLTLFGKAAAPLTKMLIELPNNIRSLPFNIFLDNLFCGPSLFSFLRENNYSATGTFRENRISINSHSKPVGKKKNPL